MLPVSFVPHGSSGGTFFCWCGKVDEDGDVVRTGRGQGRGIPGPKGRTEERVGKGEVHGARPTGAQEGKSGIDTRGVEEGTQLLGGKAPFYSGSFPQP